MEPPEPTSPLDDPATVADFHEYLALLSLRSPRVTASDKPDPYICRYDIPSHITSSAKVAETSCSIASTTQLHFTGFFPSLSLLKIFVAMKRAVAEAKEEGKSGVWGCIIAHGLREAGSLVLIVRPAGMAVGEEFLLWQHGVCAGARF